MPLKNKTKNPCTLHRQNFECRDCLYNKTTNETLQSSLVFLFYHKRRWCKED
nr:MAG TPA: hypothetical protein [Caudoviricetes sp.]